MTSADFLAQWRCLVGHWVSERRTGPGAADVRDLLDRGLDAVVADLHRPGSGRPAPSVPSEQDLLRCETAVVSRSGLLDVPLYTRVNPPVRNGKIGAAEHFCGTGWQTLCNPSREFDVWWYWAEYLDPTAADVDPLLHYLLVGRHLGHAPVQPRLPPRPPATYVAGRRPRRVCLFAGYDNDGVVDDYVLDFLRELNRHADVYYLADGYVEPDELAKLAPYTKGAWAVAHGAYDFGSLSILARDLVGWDVIDTYDEMVFANDSTFLLRPLDDVFAAMDGRASDWWGLQASKHGFEKHSNHGLPLDADEVKSRMIGERVMNDNDHLHVSSYFMVFRAPVVRDPGFRRRVESVVPQVDKQLVITKYEIGLSRYLMCRGFDYDTFVPGLYPFHPLYTEQYFDLLELGFPLLKRNFLSENSRNVPDLVHWKERVLAAVPDAPVDRMEHNLLRVSPDDRLQRSFALLRDAGARTVVPRPWPWWELVREDRHAPKFDHWWAFPVDDRDHLLPGASRAVLEAVRDDPSVKKIVLTRSRRVDLAGENVTVAPLHSQLGQHLLVRSAHVFVHEAPGEEAPPLVPARLHRIINLAQVPLEYVAAAAEDAPRARYHAVVTSSRLAALIALTAFQLLDREDVWVTGDPRNDHVLGPSHRLPADLREQEERLRVVVGDRRLVLVEPTYRGGSPATPASTCASWTGCRAGAPGTGWSSASATIPPTGPGS
ncbi:rhamnan synthesis F family protein [Nocardioides panacis]|uniref:Rhamnan synthesis F family protein n=1 Tax=Nocardioides panacis TaxID=2849501 RepID=A0A975XZB5_9ACTN|nr:rhamnan synthesis F family protein [Nocardioides panacis]QWZ07223.1 rhamnan synthesis F family protein [Nocardioides panacis]